MAEIVPTDYALPPNSKEAERAVLGSVLIDPDAMMVVRQTGLEKDDFYHIYHQVVFAAMLDLANSYQPIDTVTLGSALARIPGPDGSSQLDGLGGLPYLTRLIESTPTSAYAENYAKLVHTLGLQRMGMKVGQQIVDRCAKFNGSDVSELYSDIGGLFYGAITLTDQNSHLYGTDDSLLRYLETQTERRELLARNPHALIRTYLAPLDELLGNLEPGTLLAIAARPGVGKTILMEHISEANAAHQKRVAFYHLELSHQFMLDRRMARWSGISLDRLRAGYQGDEIPRALEVMAPWQSNLVYVHCPGWTAERIAADMIRLAARGECDLAVVDYLQKITLPDRHGWNASMLYGLMAEQLKITAERLGIPVVLGTQVSRDWKQNEGKRPTSGDIRNSGEIEEKANQIVVLHRPEQSTPRTSGYHERIEVYVEKNTGGAQGQCELTHALGRYDVSAT